MRVIIKRTGQNSIQDTSFITTDNASHYIRSLKTDSSEVIDYNKELPNINSDLIALLKSLIQVNPFFRPTAKECLKSSVFDTVRD